MKKNRIALIASAKPSAWVSCRVITPNLTAAYERALAGRTDLFSYPPGILPPDIWKLAVAIHASRPERIVFLDHAPHPEPLLRALEGVYAPAALPPVVVHAYGDFTLTTSRWTRVEKMLKRTRALFVGASPRQNELLRRFVVDPRAVGPHCPFPMDASRFRFEPGARERVRERLGIAPGELALVYTGRLSLQKNVTRMLTEIEAFQKFAGVPTRLLIAGSFDDLYAPFFGVREKRGSYYRLWSETLSGLGPEFRSRVNYLGSLEAPALAELYHAGDAFVSLSLHHDEDFGMSVAEALACGTPAIISDWAGYSGFADAQPQDVKLVGVKLTEQGLVFQKGAFQRELFRVAAAASGQGPDLLSAHAREARSARARDWVSIEAVAEKIRAIHAGPLPAFQGFSWLLGEHASVMARKVPFPDGPRKNSFYEVVYGAYAPH